MWMRFALTALITVTACGQDEVQPAGTNTSEGAQSTGACTADYSDVNTDPALASAACSAMLRGVCARAGGDCSDGTFNDPSECLEYFTGYCDEEYMEGFWGNRDMIEVCSGQLEYADCSFPFVYSDGYSLYPLAPESCTAAWSYLPPDTAGCTEFTAPGSVAATVDASSSSTYMDYPATMLCACLDAGLEVSVALLDSGASPASDLIVLVFDPNGANVAYNDDSATSYMPEIVRFVPWVSGSYTFVVLPYDESSGGDFDLVVEAL